MIPSSVSLNCIKWVKKNNNKNNNNLQNTLLFSEEYSSETKLKEVLRMRSFMLLRYRVHIPVVLFRAIVTPNLTVRLFQSTLQHKTVTKMLLVSCNN